MPKERRRESFFGPGPSADYTSPLLETPTDRVVGDDFGRERLGTPPWAGGNPGTPPWAGGVGLAGLFPADTGSGGSVGSEDGGGSVGGGSMGSADGGRSVGSGSVGGGSVGSAGGRSRARFVSTPPSPSYTMNDPISDWADFEEGDEDGDTPRGSALEAVRASRTGFDGEALPPPTPPTPLQVSPPGTPIVMSSTVGADALDDGTESPTKHHGFMEATYANADTVVFVGGQEVDLDAEWTEVSRAGGILPNDYGGDNSTVSDGDGDDELDDWWPVEGDPTSEEEILNELRSLGVGVGVGMGLEAATTELEMGSVLDDMGSHAETAGATHGRGEAEDGPLAASG